MTETATVTQRINELRDHLAFLQRNGFCGCDEIEAKITALNQERKV